MSASEIAKKIVAVERVLAKLDEAKREMCPGHYSLYGGELYCDGFKVAGPEGAEAFKKLIEAEHVIEEYKEKLMEELRRAVLEETIQERIEAVLRAARREEA